LFAELYKLPHGYGGTSEFPFLWNHPELKEKEVIMLDNLRTQEFDKKAGRIGGHIFRDLKKEGKIPKTEKYLR